MSSPQDCSLTTSQSSDFAHVVRGDRKTLIERSLARTARHYSQWWANEDPGCGHATKCEFLRNRQRKSRVDCRTNENCGNPRAPAHPTRPRIAPNQLDFLDTDWRIMRVQALAFGV